MKTHPVLDGYVTRNGVQVAVWCKHCRRDHYHGHHGSDPDCTFDGRRNRRCVCPIGSGDGHRVAHCSKPDSPYYDTGYVIREVGWKDPAN